jgi:hypothetical protein
MVDRARQAAVQVIERLMPNVLVWGNPARSAEKNAKPSSYIATCVFNALRRLRRIQRDLNSRFVSIDSGGTKGDGSASRIDVADSALNIEELMEREQEARIREREARVIMRHFDSDELRFIAQEISALEWCELGRNVAPDRAYKQRYKMIDEARHLIGLPPKASRKKKR